MRERSSMTTVIFHSPNTDRQPVSRDSAGNHTEKLGAAVKHPHSGSTCSMGPVYWPTFTSNMTQFYRSMYHAWSIWVSVYTSIMAITHRMLINFHWNSYRSWSKLSHSRKEWYIYVSQLCVNHSLKGIDRNCIYFRYGSPTVYYERNGRSINEETTQIFDGKSPAMAKLVMVY